MTQQIAFGTRYEDLLAEEALERGMTAVVDDLNDQLAVICGAAKLGAEASYDAELTESYFTRIESAAEKAAQITRQLVVLDPRWPSEDKHPQAVARPRVLHAIDATIDPRPAASSFRRRLTAARTLVHESWGSED